MTNAGWRTFSHFLLQSTYISIVARSKLAAGLRAINSVINGQSGVIQDRQTQRARATSGVQAQLSLIN